MTLHACVNAAGHPVAIPAWLKEPFLTDSKKA
jgi:hypothetical protein